MPVFHDSDFAARAARVALTPARMPDTAAGSRASVGPIPSNGPADMAAQLASLPELGTVLCHVADRPWSAAQEHSSRIWPSHPWLTALPGTVSVRGFAQLDSDGPCEWLECADQSGRTWMRIALLPDSDYCAWDRLQQRLAFGIEDAFAAAPSCARRAAWLRGLRGGAHGRVAVVRFHRHAWVGQIWLGMDDAAASRLGRERAAQLAGQWHLGRLRSCRGGA